MHDVIFKKDITDEEIAFFNQNTRCMFQDYPWISLWDKVFQGNGSFAVYEEKGAINAIFPFYIKKNSDHSLPFLSWKELLLMATGSQISTDYADFPAIKDPSSLWKEKIIRFLQENPNWDVIRFNNVLEDSNAYSLYEALRDRGYPTTIINRLHCPYFELDFENVDSFIRTKPRKFRDNLMRRVRNINKQCDIRYESDVTADNWDSLFDNLVRLHNIRKETKGITGKFSDYYYTQFHKGAFRSYVSSGKLFIPRLMDGGKIIAITYAYIDKGVYYGYQTGMDPAYRVFSPGEVLTYYIVDDLKRRGARRFDFLRGDERYKYNWSTNESDMKDLMIFRKSAKGFILHVVLKGMKLLRESVFVGKARKIFRHEAGN